MTQKNKHLKLKKKKTELDKMMRLLFSFYKFKIAQFTMFYYEVILIL